MKKDFFADYKRPEWQKFRLEVLSAHGFKCQYCGDDKAQLHVHHFFYRKLSKPWEYEVAEMRCLCDSCHEVEHERYERVDQSEGGVDVFNPCESGFESLLSACAKTGLRPYEIEWIIEMGAIIDKHAQIERIAQAIVGVTNGK